MEPGIRSPFTPRLDAGAQTFGLDIGPLTPGLDSNPVRPDPHTEMEGFIKDTFAQKDALRIAERSAPRTHQPIQSTFVSSPMPLLPTEAPRGRRQTRESVVAGTATTSSGAFCTLYQNDDLDWFITGGPVHAGVKNFNVPDFAVDVGTDDEFIVFITVNVEAYRDDNDDYFLPGIKTSSDTSLTMEWDTAADYPDNTDPPVSTGLGIIILPVGRVVVLSGVPSFQPTACGGFIVAQCGGSLSYRRI